MVNEKTDLKNPENGYIKKVERETLATFMKHRPSEYFSHIGDKDSFESHHRRVELLYRFGLALPPEFFCGRNVIDLGAGTGEHTISLAKWGAVCTLVEMNREAVDVAKKVFQEHLNNFEAHTFLTTSLYDIDLSSLKEKFDISHSRGVFTHVADKREAFRILAALAKPGGYVVYGDRNTLGGLQEMIQRYAIYKLGGTEDGKIIEVAEALFSDDIDRSQRALPRTREAIIFDRWVIQQQDDPSVDDVFTLFDEQGLQYVSSWPRIDFSGRGTSTHSDPRTWAEIRLGAQFVETLWMMLNQGENENISSLEFLESQGDFYNQLSRLGSLLRNVQISSSLSTETLLDQLRTLSELIAPREPSCSARLLSFLGEISDFLKIVDQGAELRVIRWRIDQFKILFKGFAGVRHVDYLAYKPNR